MWLKTSDDFPDDMYRFRVSDSAYRAHHEGLSWSNRHLLDGRLPREDVGRFFCLGSNVPEAVAELVAKGIWIEDGDDFVIVHHLDEQLTREQVLRRRRNDADRQSRKRDADAQAAEDRNKKRKPRTPRAPKKTSRRDTERDSDTDTDRESQVDDPRDLREGEGRTGQDRSVTTEIPEARENDEGWPDVAIPGQRTSDDNVRPADRWRVSGEPA